MNDYKDWINQNPLTIVESGSLHFCLEYREVEIAGQIVELTAKEFDILALLILNPRRVFTYCLHAVSPAGWFAAFWLPRGLLRLILRLRTKTEYS